MTLEVDAVTKTYGLGDERTSTITALDGIDLTVAEGEFVSIIGPTGCGKSTLFEIIGGLVEPTDGEVRLQGDPIAGPDPRIGMVFQDHSTFPWLSVRENVEFGLRMNGVAKSEYRARAEEMLDLVGLSGFEDARPGELSGGMNQRVAIARTLVMGPELILMDEPFGALDEQTRLILGGELLRIWRETGATILFVTHNINEAVQLSDRIAVMSARPGRFKTVVENALPRPRDDDAMGTEAFNEIVRKLWGELKEESRRGMEQTARVEG
ncbi:ABC transporter ATP-binding protein [Halomarina pelagica]|uniref:ABC transporter ATP-binding protein n=1 Tax=Halomarina pelagica TaxID=2961599 RepID=UPI0020C20041|nr:ABC transporter ATP-binding protein [Halomarina sp. BND7]